MAKGSERLWFHGKKWYLKLAIPRPLQPYFLSSAGKPTAKIVEPLAGDHAIAKIKAAQRVAECLAVFDQIRAGIISTPEQAKAALMRGPVVDAEGNPEIPGHTAALHAAMQRWADERRAAWFQSYGALALDIGRADQPAAQPASTGETISQALEGWIKDLTSNRPRRPATLKGHHVRVQAFIDKFGDLPLTEVTRSMAYDFLSGLGRANRTRNNYAMTLSGIFKCAKLRGRFAGENPFEAMKVEDTGASREPFTVEELQTLFDNLPRDTNPRKHSPATALPWVALISAYSGACLEEICQLTLDDIREEEANGGTVTIFDIHNGDDEHKVKNEEARPRYLPMHSALVRAGLLEYIANLRRHGHTRVFPGLKQRPSKDNKWSPEVGHRFGKALRRLGLKREGLCFHSFRHTVNKMLEEYARVPEVDRARVLGHVHPTMTARYGKGKAAFRSAGPMLKIVAGVVEEIKYEGLRLT
jgi:integrase